MLILMLSVMSVGMAWGQDKKVAMLEPVVKGGSVTQIEKEIIKGAGKRGEYVQGCTRMERIWKHNSQ
jgi:hypothetical protein